MLYWTEPAAQLGVSECVVAEGVAVARPHPSQYMTEGRKTWLDWLRGVIKAYARRSWPREWSQAREI